MKCGDEVKALVNFTFNKKKEIIYGEKYKILKFGFWKDSIHIINEFGKENSYNIEYFELFKN